ncbi:hypothetical protein LSAT2_024468 [Lamellibrachia satsuma]|nr:hypothetical protein LSAT2_024468 [Lamellibrachia satsuma]
MRCLRRAVNKTKRDMKRNEHIREMVGTPAHYYIQQHLPTTTYNNTSPPLHTTTPAHHYIQQHQPTTTYNNTSPPLHTTTENHGIPPLQAFQLAADRQLHLPATPPEQADR